MTISAQRAGPRPAWRRAQAAALVFQVLDINIAAAHTGSAFSDTAPPANPRQSAPQMAVVGSTLYFTADDGVHGVELSGSDGTGPGTNMVDINPGADSSSPAGLENLNGELYFTANDGVHGRELWKTNGTIPGTTMVADINPGAGGSSPANLTAASAKGLVLFSANDRVHGSELWQSDGTAAGTIMVQDITGNAGSASPSGLELAGPAIFFAANDGLHGRELWEDFLSPRTSFLPLAQR